MAGAKAHLLQPELQTDAEWRAAVLSEQAKQCLAVVDVWPDWSGPCEAMRGRLVWFKLTEAGDDLLLFSANASAIDALDRFRDHSEPTFMFLGGGQLVNVYIGCSRPRLIELVRRELRQERCVQRGTARRRVLPAGKPSPAERERRDARAAKDTAARQEEKDRAEAALRVVRLRQYRALADRLHNHTVVLLLPHALRQERLPQLTAALEASWRALGVHVLRSHRLARIVAETVYGFYPGSASTSARNDSLSEFFSPVGGSGTSPAGTLPPASRRSSPLHSVSAGQFRPSTASWVRQSVLNLTRAGLGHSRHDLGELAAVAEDEAEDWDDHDLGDVQVHVRGQAWPKELRPVVDSVAAALLHRSDSGGLVLPGVWTPLTALSKAAAVRVLFHSFAAQYYEPEEPAPPPPPAIIVGFHASKRQQVLETAANFRADIMHLGFFTKDRKLLAETPGQYDALPYKEFRDRVVLALSQARGDDLLLELADFGPTYVSPTAAQAKIDVEQLFTGDVVRAPPRLGPPVGEGDADEAEAAIPALLMFSRQQQAAAARRPGPPPRPPATPPSAPAPAVPVSPGPPTAPPQPAGVAAAEQASEEVVRRPPRTPSSTGLGSSAPGTTRPRPRLSGESRPRMSTSSSGSPAADQRPPRTPSVSSAGRHQPERSPVATSAYSLGRTSQHSQHSQRSAHRSTSPQALQAGVEAVAPEAAGSTSRRPSATAGIAAATAGSQSPHRASLVSREGTCSSETLKASTHYSSCRVSGDTMEERPQNARSSTGRSFET
ncbi:hypothetical protein ONE63_004420 [Megalurothrips usitatus]|uniref:DUF4746 domain-containing protein n=1 Tax=Megalurothrips usitatus TaxID=439358 RepID=A0AAV7X2S2_9NEOP|nr:hypothetical protein ONE63_004420 [Megalurothrips usitatus]